MFLALILALGLCTTAFAAAEDTGFSDVAPTPYYAAAAALDKVPHSAKGTNCHSSSSSIMKHTSNLSSIIARQAMSSKSVFNL